MPENVANRGGGRFKSTGMMLWRGNGSYYLWHQSGMRHTNLNRDGRARADDLKNRTGEHGSRNKVLDGCDLRTLKKTFNVQLIRASENEDDVDGNKDGRGDGQHVWIQYECR